MRFRGSIELSLSALPCSYEQTFCCSRLKDCTQAIALLVERTPEYELADKGYDGEAIVEHIGAMGAVVIMPPKTNHKQQRKYYKNHYRQRNRIERCFSRLKHFRRFATRYEKLKSNFIALVALACSWLHLPLCVDTAELVVVSVPSAIRTELQWPVQNPLAAKKYRAEKLMTLCKFCGSGV
jgi:transposase